MAPRVFILGCIVSLTHDAAAGLCDCRFFFVVMQVLDNTSELEPGSVKVRGRHMTANHLEGGNRAMLLETIVPCAHMVCLVPGAWALPGKHVLV